MPDVSVSLTAGAEKMDGVVSAKAGAEIEMEFDPAKATLKVDYSREDRLLLSLEGEYSLKPKGVPLVFGAGTELSPSGFQNVSGSVTWDIAKHVSANAEVSYGKSGTTGMGTVTIRF